MGDLAAFILGRIEEDEAVARAATDGGFGWRLADLAGANEVWANRDAAGHDAFMVATTATRLNPNPGETGYVDAAHIARHDPARVLAQCTALRAVVDLHRLEHHREWCEEDGAIYPCPTLRALASIWAEHEDYDPAWRLG